MFGKLVPVPSGAVIPERDIGKRPILNCINLGVTFGGLKAVDDFNLIIPPPVSSVPTAQAKPRCSTC